MKKFSKYWKSSKNPKKQRKYRNNAPMHIRSKMMVSKLSKKLREIYKRKNIPIKKGDKVMIMRGKFKGVEGAIIEVSRKNYKIKIDNAKITSSSGKDINVWIDPSNVQIIELNTDDKKRFKRQKVIE